MWAVMASHHVHLMSVTFLKQQGINIYISNLYPKVAFISFSYVEDFANSNAYFVEEFGKVYSKVLSKGYENLETLS